MSIKQIQNGLGVATDGAWGVISQGALVDSPLVLNLSFDKLRSYFGRFNQKQIDGFNAVLKAANNYKNVMGKLAAKNPLYLAYMLATAWHETAHTMQPIAEYGKGKGRKYGDYCDMDGSRYTELPHLYYGRGYVQLTWLTNYKKFTKLLNVDLVNCPDNALQEKIAADIMLLGMVDGLFTGKALGDYIKWGTMEEYRQARRIINGMDKADLIADYAVKFLDCIIVTDAPKPAQ